jgi:outer membrane protein insertion porin family
VARNRRPVLSGGRWLRFLAFALLLCALAQAQQEVISDIVPRGNRRVPADTIRGLMSTRRGDVYDPAVLERDFNALWNTGYFDDLRFEREQTPKGWVIYVYVKEKPTIREIRYEGLSAISQSDLLDKFKERKVGMSQESRFDPTRVKRAEVVIKEIEAAHGRLYATVRTEVYSIPPASVGVRFVIKEGPKVKVGKISFQGNKRVSARTLKRAMKNTHPLGIPHSIILENLFARTFDTSKLSEDAERVRYQYQTLGYYKAVVQDPKTSIHDKTSLSWYLVKPKRGKVADITVPVEEGARYRLKTITFSGNKVISNTASLRKLFRMKDGEIFNAELMRKGLEQMRKSYGAFGYINFTAVPDLTFDEKRKLISVKIDVDEGKQFYVRRIEFQGNTTTRDKVIRRQLMLEEGQVYNSQLWEVSLLRLNQLQYFEPLKPEKDSEVRQFPAETSVDITLKVKEKGKNTIGLTGGVSGLAGTFIGLTYSTNNFLGLGETLTLGGTVGQFQRDITFAFTEPYLFDRPLQTGFTVYSRRFDYNQAKQANLFFNGNLNLPAAVLNSLQNYSQSSTGFTVSASYPIKRSFKRVGLTYGFDVSSISTFTTASQLFFQDIAFRNISGPNALNGIRTSKLTPNFSWNRIDYPMRPHNGKSFFASFDIGGIGGNVNMLRPTIEYKEFIPMKGFRPKYGHPEEGRQTFGFRILASHVSGYGGVGVSPFERAFLGGDTDLRGFDVRSVSPVAWLASTTQVTIQNPPGTTVPINPNNPRSPGQVANIPIYQLIFPGGDTSFVTNAEYRIPIIGPVTLAVFADAGWDMILRQSQLRIAPNILSGFDPSTGLPNGLNNRTDYGCVGIYCNTNNTLQSFLPGFNFPADVRPISGTNGILRMSTGLELQVILPIINAPFRIYYAYNPKRLDTVAIPPTGPAGQSLIQRSMFPPGGAGDYTYQQTMALFGVGYRLKEPANTFRFTVSTTF